MGNGVGNLQAFMAAGALLHMNSHKLGGALTVFDYGLGQLLLYISDRRQQFSYSSPWVELSIGSPAWPLAIRIQASFVEVSPSIVMRLKDLSAAF